MNNVLNDFKSKFERRFVEQSILNLGEDSLRYDFFVALMNGYNLQPHQIQVEFPIHSSAFISNPNPNSKRNEKPQIDLYSATDNLVLTAEFGLFKRNSNDNGEINPTEKVFKMLNDMLRLSLNRIYVPSLSYFICVADSKILGKKMRHNILPTFPALNYSFSFNDLNQWIDTIKSADNVFDKRFVEKANILQHNIQAKLIYDERIQNPNNNLMPKNNLETRVLVYQIDTFKMISEL
jgi:hypothetical protein